MLINILLGMIAVQSAFVCVVLYKLLFKMQPEEEKGKKRKMGF